MLLLCLCYSFIVIVVVMVFSCVYGIDVLFNISMLLILYDI